MKNRLHHVTPEAGRASEAHCLHGGPLFDGQRYHPEGHVIIEHGRIAAAKPGSPSPSVRSSQDVQGRLIAPGFVDLHCDALEKCIELRPGARFDHGFALENLDRRLAACGVTSFCHAVAFLDTEMGLRRPETAAAIVRSIGEFTESDRALVKHGAHIRFEVGSLDSAAVIRNLLRYNLSTLFSVMDHSPGQGQFKSMESFLHYYAETYAISLEEAERIGGERSAQRGHAWEDSLELLEEVRISGLPILSHDDDTADKVSMVKDLGATGCEFPVSLEAARQAREFGMTICMGAPNLLRGRSTNGNVTAAEVLQSGLCDVLVSDYAPESLLQGPFYAQQSFGLDLAEVLATTTVNPGALLQSGSGGPGRLTVGAPADVIILDTSPPWVRVWETWVDGRRVYAAH